MAKKVFLIILLCLIISCKKKDEYSSVSFFDMGTYVDVTLHTKNQEYFKKVSDFIKDLSKNISSETDKINNARSNQEIEITTDFCNLLKKGNEYRSISNGKFNIAIFTLLDLYGFPDGDFHNISESEKLEALNIAKVGLTLLESNNKCIVINNGAKIDLGAYAKGYIVDEASKFLKNEGVEDFIISAGGDMYVSGLKDGKKWRIGIKNPYEKGLIHSIELSNSALATSGNYERFFTTDEGKKISHLIDGETGNQGENFDSVSVVSSSVEVADAYATIYFFMTEEEIENRCKKDNTIVFAVKNKKLIEFCNQGKL